MATLTNNPKVKSPSQIPVKIIDSIYNLKYEKKFFSWTNLKEIKNYIEQKNGVRPSNKGYFSTNSSFCQPHNCGGPA
jgi:hypothetical protein